MMKDIGYAGVYHDGSSSIGATLEAPQKFNLAADALVFVVTAETRSSNGIAPQLEDLKFYVLDEQDQMHLTHMLPYPEEVACDENVGAIEATSATPRALICTTLRPEFIFQTLRIVVYFKGRERMGIIKLQH